MREGEAQQIFQNVPLPPPPPPTGAGPAATAGGCGHPHLLQPSLLRREGTERCRKQKCVERAYFQPAKKIHVKQGTLREMHP